MTTNLKMVAFVEAVVSLADTTGHKYLPIRNIKVSSHDKLNAYVVAGTTWKCSGIAVL
jgi:hypothetical protein